MRGRTMRVLVAAAAGALVTATYAATAVAAPAQEPQTAPHISSPAPQSGVTQGAEVAVVGHGCAPDGEVAIEFNDIPMGTTTADASGAFTRSIGIPVYEIPDVEEGQEATIAAVCGGQRATTLVVVAEAAGGNGEAYAGGSTPTTQPDASSAGGGPDDLDTLPETGAGATVALTALGGTLVAGGALLVRQGRARRARGAA